VTTSTEKDYGTPGEALIGAIVRAGRLAADPGFDGARLMEARFGQRRVGSRGYYFLLRFQIELENQQTPHGTAKDEWLAEIGRSFHRHFEIKLRA
jgi:hypothetical protein